MGWNSLKLSGDGRLFKDLPEDPYVYFVHSYYLKAEENIVKARTWYSTDIDASVEKGNVFACQFHPEKSSRTGLQILKNPCRAGRGRLLMFTKRIIPCLDVKNGRVVKGASLSWI